MLPRLDAVVGEVDQMVTIRIKQNSAVGGSLVTMVQDVPVKNTTLHDVLLVIELQNHSSSANIGSFFEKTKPLSDNSFFSRFS